MLSGRLVLGCCGAAQLGEIETDKATMAFDSPEDGFIGKLLVDEGDADIPLGVVSHSASSSTCPRRP